MSRQADLNPPLGWDGGVCKVVDRIEDRVRNPRLKHNLAEKVEDGVDLTNPEAAKIYRIHTERGPGGPIKNMRITNHAQYRMDQKGITVGDLRIALKHFTRKLNDWKSQRDPQYATVMTTLQRGRPTFRWIDEKLGDLVVVFAGAGRDTVNIVTTYWKGLDNPRPETCGMHPRHAGIQPENSFSQTYVKEKKPQDSDTGKPQGGDGKYPTRGLPSPPWKKQKNIGPTNFNGPGESGSNSDGNVHKDKARTKGVPGGQYDGGRTHPLPNYNETGITPQRRPGMTADGDGDFDLEEWPDGDVLEAASYTPQFPSAHPPGSKRQREQKGEAKRYFQRRYKRNKGRILPEAKRRHRRLRTNNRYKNKRDKYDERPERHKRRPGGPSSVAERSREQRKENKGTRDRGSRNDRNRQAFRRVAFSDVFDLLSIESDLPCSGGLFDRLASDVTASFFREQRPPAMEPDTRYDRGTSPEEARKRRKVKPKPGDPNFYGPMSPVEDSNPGSRVLPRGKGHVMDKNAALIRDIRQGCAPDLVERSRGLSFRLARVDQKNSVWLFDVKGSSGSYRVRLKAARKGNVRDLRKTHVKVSCSCPFWQWQGPEHWAKQGGYLYGRPVGTASRPGAKDPKGQHRACKHVLAVLDHVTSKQWALKPGKRASLRYLADTLQGAEVFAVPTSVDRLAARYLALHQDGGA